MSSHGAAGKTILVLGAGVGGLVTASILRRRLPKRHRVVVVDRERHFHFQPAYPWVMLGHREPDDIRRPLRVLEKKGIEVLEAEVLGLDPAKKTVATSQGARPFDYLVIALGADLAEEKVPGFKESALNLYTLAGALRIRERLPRFQGKKVTLLISSTPFRCPAAPYEAAFLVRDFLQANRSPAAVEVYTPEPFPMPAAGPAVGRALLEMLRARGIEVHTEHKVTDIAQADGRISFDNGTKVPYELLIGVPPHGAPRAARESGLVDGSGWIPVDPRTLATRHERVYALGDITSIPIAGGKSLPKAGVFAHHQAEVVAENIVADLRGLSSTREFDGRGWCAIEMGSGRAAFGSGNFYDQAGPKVNLYSPARHWHWFKTAFEKWWLWKWF